MWAVAVVTVFAGLVAGCGSGSPGTPAAASGSVAACREQGRAIADDALKFLLRAGSESEDVSYFAFGDDLAAFQRRACPPQILGAALARWLSRRERAGLLSHLPASQVRYLRRALACSQSRASLPLGVPWIGMPLACSGSASSAQPVVVAAPTTGRFPFTP